MSWCIELRFEMKEIDSEDMQGFCSSKAKEISILQEVGKHRTVVVNS